MPRRRRVGGSWRLPRRGGATLPGAARPGDNSNELVRQEASSSRTYSRTSLTARARRTPIHYAIAAHEASERRACRVVGLSRSGKPYDPMGRDDGAVIGALGELPSGIRAFGFPKLSVLLRGAGHPWNYKRVWRVYCARRLNRRRRFKNRYWASVPAGLLQLIRSGAGAVGGLRERRPARRPRLPDLRRERQL